MFIELKLVIHQDLKRLIPGSKGSRRDMFAKV